MTTPDTVADVLDAAADYIDTHGHHRDSLLDPATGAVCHNGAVYAVLGGVTRDDEGLWNVHPIDTATNSLFVAAVRATADYLGLDPHPVEHLPEWNDRSDAATVTGTMRDVAIKVRGDASDGGLL